MAQGHKYRIERGVAIIEVVGEQTFDGMIEMSKRLYADPSFRGDMPRIYDTRRQTSFFGLDDMIRFRDELSRINPARKLRRRLGVVAKDVMVEKLIKLYHEVYNLKSDGGSIEIRVFTTLEDAEAWARGKTSAS